MLPLSFDCVMFVLVLVSSHSSSCVYKEVVLPTILGMPRIITRGQGTGLFFVLVLFCVSNNSLSILLFSLSEMMLWSQTVFKVAISLKWKHL